jgi:hypothetical protein
MGWASGICHINEQILVPTSIETISSVKLLKGLFRIWVTKYYRLKADRLNGQVTESNGFQAETRDYDFARSTT